MYYQFLLLIFDNGRIAVPVEKVIGLVGGVHDEYMVLGDGLRAMGNVLEAKPVQKKEKKKKKSKHNCGLEVSRK